ncbi:hypothetical protein BDR04DRAFT_1186464 [Suillus decipiens]|nr:hypothetical protein BDR04DRAFT_1186464 [Suillus decipiens]
MANIPTPGWFHGKPDKNAQNFLREVECYIVLSDLKNEMAKVLIFSTLLSTGSVTDIWWMKLDSTHKTMWTDVKAQFTTRWPAITIAEKTGLDYQREILVIHLKEEELGTQIMVAGVPTWAHMQFRMKLLELVNEAEKEVTAGLVYQVQENLPAVIKKLTMPGIAEWDKFLTKIKDIDTNKLREKAEGARKKQEVEKAQNAHIMRLENLQPDTVKILRLQLQHTNLGGNQTTTNPMSSTTNTMYSLAAPCIHYVQKGASPNPCQTNIRQHQPLTQEEKDLLRKNIDNIPHQLDTAAARAEYEEQLKWWFNANGHDNKVTENTPFLLRPGSTMIFSSKCF